MITRTGLRTANKVLLALLVVFAVWTGLSTAQAATSYTFLSVEKGECVAVQEFPDLQSCSRTLVKSEPGRPASYLCIEATAPESERCRVSGPVVNPPAVSLLDCDTDLGVYLSGLVEFADKWRFPNVAAIYLKGREVCGIEGDLTLRQIADRMRAMGVRLRDEK